MSDILLPDLPGLTWDTTKAPEFSTLAQRSNALQEARASLAPYPLWHFRHAYSVLRAEAAYTELQQLLGFFLARRGKWDSWLFADPDDSTATAEPFGTGNGTDDEFQLARSLGGFVEPCKNVAALPLIYVAGVLKTAGSDYTVSATGLVTFASPPAGSAALTWSGTYYYRCRWTEDTSEYTQFAQRLWSAQECRFVGSLGRQV